MQRSSTGQHTLPIMDSICGAQHGVFDLTGKAQTNITVVVCYRRAVPSLRASCQILSHTCGELPDAELRPWAKMHEELGQA